MLAVAIVMLSLMVAVLLLPRSGREPPLEYNASISCPATNLSIDDRAGNPNLTVLLLGQDLEPLSGASGYVMLLDRNLSLHEANGTYRATLSNVSEGMYNATIVMTKAGYKIPRLATTISVISTRWLPRLEYMVDFSNLSFEIDRPKVCLIEPAGDFGVNITILNDKSMNPIIDFELPLPQDLNLSIYHYAQINISFQNCASFRIGLEDGKDRKVWHAFSKTSMAGTTSLDWNFRWEEEDAFKMDFGNVTRILFKTRQRYDGSNHSIVIHSLTFIRERVDLKPTLHEAINVTLGARAHPLFIDRDTGLPFEFINLKMRKVPQSSDLDFTIGNNEIGEGLTSFWMYYFGSGEDWVGDLLHEVTVAEVKYLDPGTGLIGLHHFDTRTEKLEQNTHCLEGCKFRGGPAGDSSAQHGGEDPMYMMLPASWHFGEMEAVGALERFSRSLLLINSDPKCIHLHLLLKRCRGKWYTADWNGKYGDERDIVDPRPGAYSDMVEFWWVTPMLGTAAVTENVTLKNEIIERCRIVIDNVIQHQDADGSIPLVYRMDGSESRFNLTFHGWCGYGVYSFFVRSVFLMHHLTGDEKYLESVERLFDWYFERGIPSTYIFASQIVFHAFYTGNDSYVVPLITHIRSKYPLDEIENDIYGCVWRLFPWVWNGSVEDLEIALEGERRYRAKNWVQIPAGSQYYHYYTPGNAEKITSGRGWCPLDVFGSAIEDFYALLQLGSKSKGLVDRDLLVLGFMSDIRAPR